MEKEVEVIKNALAASRGYGDWNYLMLSANRAEIDKLIDIAMKTYLNTSELYRKEIDFLQSRVREQVQYINSLRIKLTNQEITEARAKELIDNAEAIKEYNYIKLNKLFKYTQ